MLNCPTLFYLTKMLFQIKMTLQCVSQVFICQSLLIMTDDIWLTVPLVFYLVNTGLGRHMKYTVEC
jgi:hypothetical protein